MGMTGTYGVFVWVAAAAALFVLEAFTVQFICVWFAVGAAAAVIPAMLGAPPWVQLLVFLLSAVMFLIVIRPVFKSRLRLENRPTNADMVIGKTGIVLEDIDNLRGSGRVSAMGLTWTARTGVDGIVVPADAQVMVERIEGVKLIVNPVEAPEKETAESIHTFM